MAKKQRMPAETTEAPAPKWDMAEELQKLKASRFTQGSWQWESIRIHIRGGKTFDQALDAINEEAPKPIVGIDNHSEAAKAERRQQQKPPAILTSTAVLKGTTAPIPVGSTNGNGSTRPFKSKGDLDEFGFGSNTQVSFVVAHLAEASFTKKDITDKFLAKQLEAEAAKGSNGDATKARKASSLSVIFSDIVKPFGTYHASRSLIIVTDPKTKVMSLEPKRAEQVKKAIADGILTKLKGFNMKKHPDKVKAILKKFNLPAE